MNRNVYRTVGLDEKEATWEDQDVDERIIFKLTLMETEWESSCEHSNYLWEFVNGGTYLTS
jgi:hypothetical protein